MPSYVSPGVYVTEKDWSDYSPSLNATNIGIMGFASQGPVGKATLITNADQLISTFGRPDLATGGFGLIGAYHILERTNTLYFTRVATTSASIADAALNIGACPHVKTVSQLNPANSYTFMFDVSDGAGTLKTAYPIIVQTFSSTTLTPTELIRTAIDTKLGPTGAVSYSPIDGSSGYFVASYAGSGARLAAACWSSTSSMPSIPDGTTFFATGAGSISALFSLNSQWSSTFSGSPSGNTTLIPFNGSGELAAASGVIASGSLFNVNTVSGGALMLKSLYPGLGYNYSSYDSIYGTQYRGLRAVVTANRGSTSVVTLIRGQGVEEQNTVELTTATLLTPSANINWTTDETNKTSEYIVGEFAIDSSAYTDTTWALPASFSAVTTGVSAFVGGTTLTGTNTSRFIKLVDGSYNFAGGANGDMAGGLSFTDNAVKAALVGDAAAGTGPYSYLKEDVDISILAIPGCTQQDIINNAISIAESSQEFLVVTNPPVGIASPQAAINWSNGVGSGRTAALNTSWACVYWPWVKLFNPFTQIDEYISPDIFAIRQMAYTDANFDAWFAPAGLVRGRLTKPVDVEVVLTQGDRDALYGPGNIINPVQKFLTEGIVLWGQRTAQRAATALDRINVRRLMIIIRKMILASTRQFVFEPNDAPTWKRVQNAVEPMLADIKSRRGLVNFKVICDATTNTPLRIDRNELWCKVILQPTKTAEVIVFELNLTSATLGLDVPA